MGKIKKHWFKGLKKKKDRAVCVDGDNISIRVVTGSDRKKYITLQDAKMDVRAVEAVRSAVAKAKICEQPVAKYDVKSKRAYMEYPDGAIKYVR